MGLKLKLKKCTFLQREITFLGHVLSDQGVKAHPGKLAAVDKWPVPTSKLQVQQFMGLVNYFRKFIPDLSRKAAPLFGLMRSQTGYNWTPDCQQAFEDIKAALQSPPVLAYPNPSKPYEVISDASNQGCGAILVQDDRAVAYYSATFTPAESRYTTTEHEMLGVIKAMKEWRCYLEGCQHVTILTDNISNTYFSSQDMLSRRQARWAEYLSRFVVTWRHIPGKRNPADPLSRQPQPVQLHAHTVPAFKPEDLHKMPNYYCDDPRFADPEFCKSLDYRGGYWYDKQGKIIVPTPCVQAVIQAHHSNLFAGHFGVRKTVDLIQRNFTWPGLRAEVYRYVTACDHCQRNKFRRGKPQGLLQPLRAPDERWHEVSMDFITCLPVTQRTHYDAILVLVDRFSKMSHLVPCRTTSTTEHIISLIDANLIRLHGVPKSFVSDRDPKFTCALWTRYWQDHGTKLHHSSAFHPQSDGQTERTNQVIQEVLHNHMSDSPKRWDLLLPFVEFES